jgi:hypothetical protein
MSKEPDDTPIRADHINTFLNWYAARVRLTRFPGDEAQWMSALGKLTLGQLRHGMKSYARFETQPMLPPPLFHGLCVGTMSERAIGEFKKMRETIRKASTRVDDRYRPLK